jgi:hypothetical protein
MAYDESLAQRIREALGARRGVIEKKMFGGIAFMLDDKMACGVIKDDLMVRVGPEAHAASLSKPHVRPMDFAGRPMKGYVYVGPAGSRTVSAVKAWVERGAAHVATLPDKPKRPARKKAR